MQTVLSISDGKLHGIYSDDLRELFAEGDASISRASHVEPALDGLSWEADMSPSGGPVLGPYSTRGEAIAAEIEWLEINRL